jgi:hypothetical protein
MQQAYAIRIVHPGVSIYAVKNILPVSIAPDEDNMSPATRTFCSSRAAQGFGWIMMRLGGGPFRHCSCRPRGPAQATTALNHRPHRVVSQMYLTLTLLMLIVLAHEITAALARAARAVVARAVRRVNMGGLRPPFATEELSGSHRRSGKTIDGASFCGFVSQRVNSGRDWPCQT